MPYLDYAPALRFKRGRRLLGWTYEQTVLRDGPVSYWRLNERAGTTANDRMGANNGTYTGTYTQAEGGLATSLDGGFRAAGAGYVAIGTFTGIPVAGAARTVEAWMKPANNGGTILGYGNGATAGQDFNVQVFNSGGTWYLFSDGINAGNNLTLTGAEIPEAGRWNHIVFTLVSDVWAYYLNGELVKTNTFAVSINTATVTGARIGDRVDTAGQTIDGGLDEVAIYASTLGARAVRAHYLAGAGALGR